MSTHILSVHAEKKPFRCEICDKIFVKECNLKMYTLSVHEKKKPYKCECCEMLFSQKYHLTRHVALVHDGKKPFQCSICDFICSQNADMKKFMRRRNNSNVIFVNTVLLVSQK